MPGLPFVVDKFGPGTAGVRAEAWFLTHFHADHYGGLCPRWCQRNRGPIYCTTATAKLAADRLKVRPRNRAQGLDHDSGFRQMIGAHLLHHRHRQARGGAPQGAPVAPTLFV